MKTKNKNSDVKDRKAQKEIQDIEIKERLRHIKNKILVMSGKGGVGKSSVAAYLSVALAKRGYKVGLMDVDLHGPSIPRLLGLKGRLEPGRHAGKVQPVKYLPNMEVISIEVFAGENKDVATIWRGPLKIGAIRQFISDIEWDNLDYLIIDSPPGTGDEPLTVAQVMKGAQGIIVTTPQEVSLLDIRKSITFCRQVNMPVVGILENMSALICPHCGEKIDLFSSGGGERTARDMGVPFLGKIPIRPEIVTSTDQGQPYILRDERGKEDFGTIIERLIDGGSKE